MSSTFDMYTNYDLACDYSVFTKECHRQGISNSGNECFIIAGLHCLFNMPKLTDQILHMDYAVRNRNASVDEIAVFKSYCNLVHGAFCSDKILNIRNFITKLAKVYPVYEARAQGDAHEFILHMLNVIHTVRKHRVTMKVPKADTAILRDGLEAFVQRYKSDYSDIVPMFNIQTIVTCICNQCKKTWYTFDFVTLVDLSAINVTQNMDTPCKHCGYRECAVTTSFWELPTMHIITRFNRERERFSIDDKELMIAPSRCDSSKYIFFPTAIIFYTGSHYYVAVKKIDDVWIKFNDCNAEVIDPLHFPVSEVLLVCYSRKFKF